MYHRITLCPHCYMNPVTMKRKLNQDDVPIADSSSNASQVSPAFKIMELDPRLLQAVARQGFSTPTLVQSKAIPLAIGGKDLSGTGIFQSLFREPLLIDGCSSCKDRIWEDSRICVARSRIHTSAKGGRL